jgi:uncharacterized protein with HEPN domain
MSRDAKVILTELNDAISLAREATTGLSFEQFETDRIRNAATQRALEVISEAARHLPQILIDRHPALPWAEIRAIGNKLRHEYHRVDSKTVWDIVHFELDDLASIVDAELAAPPSD